jgi:hypothetical protein
MKRKRTKEVKFRLFGFNEVVSMSDQDWDRVCAERGVRPDPNAEDYQPPHNADPARC